MIAIIGMIHNHVADTWHPVTFRYHPMPGPGPDTMMRVKSQGHYYTVGFSTRDLANTAATTHPALQGVPFDDQFVYEWDGQGIPALVAFVTNDGKRLIAFA